MKRLTILYLLFCFSCILNAQTVVEKVETVFVSIEDTSQDVVIKWKPVNDTSKIIGYKIFEYFKNEYGVWGQDNKKPIDSTKKSDPTIDTFSYPDVKTRSVRFVVFSYISDTSLGARLNISQTIFSTVKFDSCNYTLTLTWSQYYGWGTNESTNFKGNVKEYRVFNAIANEMIGKTTDTTYLISSGISANTTYEYYIQAINSLDTTIQSKSNIVVKKTLTQRPPDSISTESATYKTDNLVQITFDIDSTSEITDFDLYRSSSTTGTFSKIASFSNVKYQLIATDSDPLSTTAYYRLQDKNYCGITAIYSDTSTAIVPVLLLGSENVTINWSPYVKWENGVSSYIVDRSLDGENFSYLGSTNGSSNSYNDNISSLKGKLTSGRIYYRVIADAKDTSFESVSKSVYIDLTSEIYIPNAFTPDGNGQNDKFQAFFAFPPTQYSLTIYNRYGSKVYETSDSSDDAGWDGMINGKKAPEGVYVYLIYYSSGDKKKVEKKGNFTLIYP